MSARDLGDFLKALGQYEIELEPEHIEPLYRYAVALWDWNERLNLTRHDDFEKFVSRDLVDSIELAELIHEQETVADLGTGGGVPGVVLAILRPDLNVSLCESVGKKAKAVEDIVQQLDLPVSVFEARFEHLLEDFRFETVVTRAVGPLWKLCFWLQDGWSAVGRLLAIKGPAWTEERKEARHRGLLNDLELRCAKIYTTPGSEAENSILKIWPKGRAEK